MSFSKKSNATGSMRQTRSSSLATTKTTLTDRQIIEESYSPIDIDKITHQNNTKKPKKDDTKDPDDAIWKTNVSPPSSSTLNTTQSTPNNHQMDKANKEDELQQLPSELTLQDISRKIICENYGSLEDSIHNHHMTDVHNMSINDQ